MKTLVSLIALMGALSSPAWAATKTVTLAVPGMTCAACPITVKTALAKVDGVEKTEVSFEKAEALLEELRPTSPLRHRLTSELEELRQLHGERVEA